MSASWTASWTNSLSDEHGCIRQSAAMLAAQEGKEMKKYRKKLWRELRDAYVALDTAPDGDENELHRRIGRYYGLRRAYSLLTGLPEDLVGQKVVSWYVRSEHYERNT